MALHGGSCCAGERNRFPSARQISCAISLALWSTFLKGIRLSHMWLLFLPFGVCFVLGPFMVMLRAHSWLCAQGIISCKTWGSIYSYGDWTKLAEYKASILPAVLSSGFISICFPFVLGLGLFRVYFWLCAQVTPGGTREIILGVRA